MPAQVADDFRVDPGNWLEFSGPVAAVVRPGEPGGRVGLPFGGHARHGLGGFHGLSRLRCIQSFVRWLASKGLASLARPDGSETRPFMVRARTIATGSLRGSIDQPAGDLGVAVDAAVA